jgi:hypothetical protein
MKKISVLLMLAFSLSILTSVAQKQLYLGLGGTMMNTWVTNETNYGYPDMDYSTTFGGGGNLNVGYDFSKNIGLKVEIGFTKLGQNTKKDIGDSAYLRKVKLNYIQIPLLFKYKTTGEVARFYLLAGPQFGILTSAKQTYYLNGDADARTFTDLKNNTHKISEESITDRYSSIDIFGRLDLGVDITLTQNLFLNAGLTFCYGFTDINATDYRIKDNDGNYNASHNIYGGLNVGICYIFDFNKK